jgi:hypothetical protein
MFPLGLPFRVIRYNQRPISHFTFLNINFVHRIKMTPVGQSDTIASQCVFIREYSAFHINLLYVFTWIIYVGSLGGSVEEVLTYRSEFEFFDSIKF